MIEIIYFVIIFIPPVAFGIFLFIGFLSPSKYKLTSSKTLTGNPEDFWIPIREFEKYKDWLSYVSNIESKQNSEGRTVWVQSGTLVPVEFEIVEEQAPHYLKMRHHQGNEKVSGDREIFLKPGPQGQTTITITQVGLVTDPFMRAYLIFFHYRRNPVRLFLECLAVHTSKPDDVKVG